MGVSVEGIAPVLFEITVVSIPTLLWQPIFYAALTRSLTGTLAQSPVRRCPTPLRVEETLMDTPSDGILLSSQLVNYAL